MNEIFEKLDILFENMNNFINLYNHLNEGLVSKYIDNKIKIFCIPRDQFVRFVGANLTYQRELLTYKELIYNPNGLTFEVLEKLKLIEIKINCNDSKFIFLLINKTSKLCNFIKKVIDENLINNLDGSDFNDYVSIQKEIMHEIINVNNVKESNFEIISDLEKTFKYTDLKDLDLEFYYQFLTHVNQLLVSIKKGKTMIIDDKKYLSNDNFNDRKQFDVLMKTINSQFVSKREFKNKIEEIESRITNIESSSSPYVMGTMVISLISLSIWKRLMRFREDFF